MTQAAAHSLTKTFKKFTVPLLDLITICNIKYVWNIFFFVIIRQKTNNLTINLTIWYILHFVSPQVLTIVISCCPLSINELDWNVYCYFKQIFIINNQSINFIISLNILNGLLQQVLVKFCGATVRERTAACDKMLYYTETYIVILTNYL